MTLDRESKRQLCQSAFGGGTPTTLVFFPAESVPVQVHLVQINAFP
jgi:hypothetical protein